MSDDAIQLRDQVSVLRRRWLVVATVLALSVAVGLVLSLLQTPTYVASTDVELVVGPSSTETTLTAEQVATEARAVTSFDALGQVIEALGLDESPEQLLETVSASPDESGAAVLTIAATRDDGEEAADIANTLRNAYLEQSGSRSSRETSEINEEIDRLNNRITSLTARIAAAAQTAPQVTRLRGLLQEKQTERDLLIDDKAAIAASSPVGVVLSPASVPDGPSSPQPVRAGILAAVIGLLLGVGAAYLRDYFDDVVRDEGSLRATLPAIPVLGRIPRWKRSRSSRAKGPQPSSLRSPTGELSEAYRAMGVNVRTLLENWQRDRGQQAKGRGSGRVLLVTSPVSGEGRTSIAVNLAVVAAQAGLRVVLVDADLRRPRIGEVFELDQQRGLADVLAGNASVRQAVAHVGLDSLLVLPGCGSGEPAPELLASPQRARVLEQLASEADLVVVDSAAVLGVADALELAKDADLTVLVVRMGVSQGGRITPALQRLEQVGAKVAGIVVTDAGTRSS